MHPKRAGVGENPAESDLINGPLRARRTIFYSVAKTRAGVKSRKCVSIFVKRAYIIKSIKVAPQKLFCPYDEYSSWGFFYFLSVFPAAQQCNISGHHIFRGAKCTERRLIYGKFEQKSYFN